MNTRNDVNISKIISHKRREKGVTQDQLAQYIGVSKASVSKWETNQSYPDITFIPLLASYFNISIDELMDYTPQLTKDEIKSIYHRLSSDFSKKDFNDVIEECKYIIKKYYSCFPLLMQMVVIMFNHHMLAESEEKKKEILQEALSLCLRIKLESNDVALSKEAVSLEATCYLMMNQAQSVLDLLGETIKPKANDNMAIAQAHMMLGNLNNADKVLQIDAYEHLLSLMGSLMSLLQLENDKFEVILNRIFVISDAFDLKKLHPNSMLLTYLSAAQVYTKKSKYEKSLDMLERYADVCINNVFPFFLHGDSFFSEIDEWFKTFDLGIGPPRSEAVIKESMIDAILKNPSFEVLKDYSRFKNIVSNLKNYLGGS